MKVSAQRLFNKPIITPETDTTIGHNINGPSLIKAPEWLENKLGEYYLYFAAHKGQYIRLAYSDSLDGDWKIYKPGTLHIKDTPFTKHIASPDVHIDNENRKIYMYYHGSGEYNGQKTCFAESSNGIDFISHTELLGPSYWRVFEYEGYYFAQTMKGCFFRSETKHTGFVKGPVLFVKKRNRKIRHSALYIKDDVLYLFHTYKGDCPEKILYRTIKINKSWLKWKTSRARILLKPDTDYEGADLPIVKSKKGIAVNRVRQLRDPAIYVEGNDVYMLYCIAGEHGIAISRLEFQQ